MTTTQLQHLLAYLGYYTGAVDGIAGTETRQAIRAFQEAFGGIAVDGIPGSQTEKALKHAVAYGSLRREAESFWEEIRYFRREEFACKCGRYCDGYPAQMSQTLVQAADAIRGHFGAPATVSSGLRCQTHNTNVGGVSNSRHMQGKAMDFSIRGIPARQLLAQAQSLPQIRYAYAIDSSYIHMDVQ